jgi:DNA polymerase III sliding clamp (beta) subunit (PCNA family)
MRVILDGQALRKVLPVLGKVVAKAKADIPSNWLRLSARDSRLVVQAINEDAYLTVWVPAEVEVDGEVCVDAGVFLKVVRSLKSKTIRLWVDGEWLVFEGEGITQKLRVKPVSDFPEFPRGVYQYSLPASVLKEGIEKVGYAVNRDKSFRGNVLNNLLLDGKGEYLNIVGSNGYMLSVFRVNVPFNQKIYIYYTVLEALHDLLKVGGEVKLGVVEKDFAKFVCLSGNNFELMVRVYAEYDYPDYEAVIPSGCNTLIELHAEDLSRVLNNFSKFQNVVFELTENSEGFKVKAYTGNPEEIEVWVRGRVWGKDLTIAFKTKQLLPFLKSINHYIQIELTDEKSPAVFVANKNYLFVVMPVLLKGRVKT